LRRSRKPIVIASRASRLAKTQTQLVGKALERLHPDVPIVYKWFQSEGDVLTDGPLINEGGKGTFTRTIEQVLLSGEADLAVHSLKDMPVENTIGLTLAAVPGRIDVRDCLISRGNVASIEQLAQEAVVGTASPRRAAQMLRLRPDLRIELIRGNVETRLNKVLNDDGQSPYDATLLAMAGLLRLGLADQATCPISPDQILPASCQGALAIQCRCDDHPALTRCLPLNNPAASTAAHGERQIIAGLGADCHSAIGVYAQPIECEPGTSAKTGDQYYRLRVRVLSLDGKRCLDADEQCLTKDLRRLVKSTIADLKKRGACALLASTTQETLQGKAVDAPQTEAAPSPSY
jgi:hydroxymethylbilane synthase